MEHVKHTNLAKIVALTLSFLLVFQSISWSLPDIVSLRKDTLKTEFHFFRRMTGRGASPTAIMRTKLLGTAQLALIGEPLDSIQKMLNIWKLRIPTGTRSRRSSRELLTTTPSNESLTISAPQEASNDPSQKLKRL